MEEEPSSSKICGLCNNKTSKYCCPRCDTLYCSVDCYKSEKHLSCSESFYRECVSEEMASLQNDNESRRKMVDILKKMRQEDLDLEEIDSLDTECYAEPSQGSYNPSAHEEYLEELDSDDNEESDLHERIKGLDLDDADALWNALNDDEKNEFEALLSQGDVSSILNSWQPWWMYSRDARLVQEVENVKEKEALQNCPQIITVPKFSTLTSLPPSSSIRYNIINVLASYAIVMRYFNGEVNAIEGTACLLEVCANLGSGRNFDDPATAVESVKQKCLQSLLIETDEASTEVMKRDTFYLLQGPSEENKLHYCCAALSDLHDMLKQAKVVLKPKTDEQPNKLPKINKKLPNINNKLPKINAKLPSIDEKSVKSSSKASFSNKFPDHKGDHLPNLDLHKLKKCIKKVEFYLSFVECCGMDFE